MRTSSVLVVALCVACSGKKTEQQSGSAVGSRVTAPGSGSAVAVTTGSGGSAAAASSACFNKNRDNALVAFVSDDKAATACVTDNSGSMEIVEPSCATVDLATGIFAIAKPPAKPAPAAVEIKQDASGVQACMAGACVTLDVPKPPKIEGGDPLKYAINANADGTLVTVVGNEAKQVLIVDTKTGKPTHTFKVGDGDYTCIEEAHFLGDTVYVINSVCAGPGGKGYLFRNGKQYGTVDGVNVYGSAPVHLDGDVWAFAGFGGSDLVLVDVKTATQLKKIEIARPATCDNCDMLGAESMIATPLVKTPTGKLVLIGSLGVSLIDPKTGKVEITHRLPACP